jgi:hypothetical protein
VHATVNAGYFIAWFLADRVIDFVDRNNLECKKNAAYYSWIDTLFAGYAG